MMKLSESARLIFIMQVSLDSGIVTRSASPTPEQRSDTSSHSSSQGIYRCLQPWHNNFSSLTSSPTSPPTLSPTPPPTSPPTSSPISLPLFMVMHSDDETVDVAGSEEEETDSEREPSAEATNSTAAFF